MSARVLHLFLWVLLVGPLSLSGWAVVRPEILASSAIDETKRSGLQMDAVTSLTEEMPGRGVERPTAASYDSPDRIPKGETENYGYDGLGSTRFLIQGSGSSWGMGDSYGYDAYGIPLTPIGNAATTRNHYRYTGEQWDADLKLYYLRARYYSPYDGRFITMDSFEGHQNDPLSLHKYLYCHADPVNNIDPSGHLVGGLKDLLGATLLQFGLRTSQATIIALPKHIAARGFMKWWWLTAGIGAGVSTLMEDTQFAMDVQLSLESNPTGSKFAYQNTKCVEFAADAMTYFLKKGGGKPRRIIYRMHYGEGPGFIYADFGFFRGQPISDNGHHRGVLYANRVFDNNVPFGTSREQWEEGYRLHIREEGPMSIGESARKGYGEIKVE